MSSRSESYYGGGWSDQPGPTSDRDDDRDRGGRFAGFAGRDRDRGGGDRGSGRVDMDKPPNSRLFIVCGRNHTETELKEHFERFGTIDDVWLVKNRSTNESKGVAYIKYAKASEAAIAMEETDNKCIGSDPKPLKVLIANSRRSGSKQDIDGQKELMRIFIMVPKIYTDDDVREKFQAYGEIDHINLLKDRRSGENKGFAYVKFRKVSSAAVAIESCDRGFKAILAEPKGHRNRDEPIPSQMHESTFTGGGGFRPDSAFDPRSNFAPPAVGGGFHAYEPNSYHHPAAVTDPQISPKLYVVVNGSVTENQLRALFDLVPGLEYCDLRQERGDFGVKGIAYVRYSTAVSAVYAKQKLDRFEYPPSCPLSVKFVEEPGSPTDTVRAQVQQGQAQLPSYTMDPTMLRLPAQQPLVHIDSECMERLFIVCNPVAPPPSVLTDIFCRFGNLIECYMLNNRNFGYAKYADKSSALKAIEMIHGQEVSGIRFKVMVADPQTNDTRKRPRTT
ncbi:RNA-binding protein 45-like isoform X2 [Asterias rubens]|uniref:RNA-binding protein 45-like isoform X2 n=1 Tax=Asterias rubens TaxID=7604 RepID=UPI001455A28E|nr:RNA-binding protein 45-like isoform X2 [Asterias rubens]